MSKFEQWNQPFIIRNRADVYQAHNVEGVLLYDDDDAATVIQSTIDLLSNGGKIIFKAGTYSISSAMGGTDKGSKICLSGEGPESTILTCSGANDIFSFTSSTGDISNLQIRDMSLKSTNAASSGNGISYTASGSYSLYHSVFRNLYFHGFLSTTKYPVDLGTAIVLSANNLFVEGCYNGVRLQTTATVEASSLYLKNYEFSASANFGVGLTLDGGAASVMGNVHLTRPHFWVGGSYTGMGLYIRNLRNGTIVTPRFEDVQNPIQIVGTSGYASQNVHVTNPSFEHTTSGAAPGTDVDFNDVYVLNCKVEHPRFYNNHGSSVKAVNDAQTVDESSNIVIDPSFDPADVSKHTFTVQNVSNWIANCNHKYAQTISNGDTHWDWTFPQKMPTANYEVFAMPYWATTVFVSNKATTGCRLNFSDPGGTNYLDAYVRQ